MYNGVSSVKESYYDSFAIGIVIVLLPNKIKQTRTRLIDHNLILNYKLLHYKIFNGKLDGKIVTIQIDICRFLNLLLQLTRVYLLGPPKDKSYNTAYVIS